LLSASFAYHQALAVPPRDFSSAQTASHFIQDFHFGALFALNLSRDTNFR